MYYIGFDIGGTKCAVSLGEIADGNITVLGREETPTTTPEATLETLAATVARFRKEKEIISAGISCGGPIDAENGVILTPPNLPKWHNFPIVEYIQKRFGLHAVLENDANACAVAEWRFGAGKGTKNMVFCTFGTGLGVGLIVNGRLYGGAEETVKEVDGKEVIETDQISPRFEDVYVISNTTLSVYNVSNQVNAYATVIMAENEVSEDQNVADAAANILNGWYGKTAEDIKAFTITETVNGTSTTYTFGCRAKKVSGVKRYADADAMKKADNDYTSFSDDYWSVSKEGVLSWKK